MSNLPGSVLVSVHPQCHSQPLGRRFDEARIGAGQANGVSFVASAGLYPTDIDGFVVSVLGEQDVDMHRHQSRPFDAHSDGGYDLIIALVQASRRRSAGRDARTGDRC